MSPLIKNSANTCANNPIFMNSDILSQPRFLQIRHFAASRNQTSHFFRIEKASLHVTTGQFRDFSAHTLSRKALRIGMHSLRYRWFPEHYQLGLDFQDTPAAFFVVEQVCVRRSIMLPIPPFALLLTKSPARYFVPSEFQPYAIPSATSIWRENVR